MGLIFPIQPDLRKSTPKTLVLESSTNRFSVGLSFLFIGLVIATMYIAAAPLFDRMWVEGALFDKALTAFFYSIIFLYPVITFVCWGFRERLILTQQEDLSLNLSSQIWIGPIKLRENTFDSLMFDDLTISNWKGAVNTASLQADSNQQMARYATKGHWLLHPKDTPSFVLEKRAKKEDVEWLLKQIEVYFFSSPASPSTAAPEAPTPEA